VRCDGNGVVGGVTDKVDGASSGVDAGGGHAGAGVNVDAVDTGVAIADDAGRQSTYLAEFGFAGQGVRSVVSVPPARISGVVDIDGGGAGDGVSDVNRAEYVLR